MKLEIKSVSLASLVTSAVPLVAFAAALLGGVVSFIMMPNPQIMPMSLWQKLMAIGLFALMYMVIVSAFLVFVVFIYNIFTSVLGMKGVTLDIEEVGHNE